MINPFTQAARGNEVLLVVDDEELILNLARQGLQKMGYQVICAVCGEEALDIYTTRHVDLVILDLGMPGMGGCKTLEKLMEFDSTVKVVIASGFTSERDINQTKRLGARDFLAKPYRFSDLLCTIRGLLDED